MTAATSFRMSCLCLGASVVVGAFSSGTAAEQRSSSHQQCSSLALP